MSFYIFKYILSIHSGYLRSLESHLYCKGQNFFFYKKLNILNTRALKEKKQYCKVHNKIAKKTDHTVFTTSEYKPVHWNSLIMIYSIKRGEWEIDFLRRIYESFRVRSTNPADLHLKSQWVLFYMQKLNS